MKRNLISLVCLLMVLGAVPAYGFLDYFFSGGNEGGETIGNSVVGDLRSWWTGNPAYNFNPYYSGSPLPQQGPTQPPTERYVPGMQGQPPQAGYGAYPPASTTYYPPQGAQAPPGQGYYPPVQQQPVPMAQQPYQQPYQQPAVQPQMQQPVMQPMQQPVQPMYGGAPPAQTYQGFPGGQAGYQTQYSQPAY